MPEELGKIEKPSVESFKGGRKLFFIPLIFSGKGLPAEFLEKYNRYWEQVDSQLSNLEAKLGPAQYIFHELVPDSGEEGLKALEELNVGSVNLIRRRIGENTTFVAIEDKELLTELMDWSRCLSLGLQSQKVISVIYESYNEANNKRNEAITQKIQETIKENESAILIMAEGHHVQFAPDIQVFYIAPPGLDEIKRWMRDFEAKGSEPSPEQPAAPEDNNTPEEKA
jgi:hypothetical protein